MSLTYPLLMPSTPNFRTAELIMAAVTGLSVDPFGGQQQAFEWPGTWWEFSGSLPLMKRVTAEPWLAFAAALRGQTQKFLLGDPLGRKTALGSLAGVANVTLKVSGVATAKTLTIWGCTANQAGVFKAGDYFQLPRNYLTGPFAIDAAPWAGFNAGGIGSPTPTANATAAPDGASTADQLVFPTTSGSQTSWWGQVSTSPDPRGLPFTFRVWLKASSGTPTIRLAVNDSAGTLVGSSLVTLSTTWTVYSVTITPTSANASGALFAYLKQDVSQSTKTIFAWGASLFSTRVGARLYKALSDTDADSSQGAVVDIFPKLRSADAGLPIITTNPMGEFRLQSSRPSWSVDQAQTYGLALSAVEAI